MSECGWEVKPIADRPAAGSAQALLVELADARRDELAATARKLRLAAQWCDLHPAESLDDAAHHGNRTMFGRERTVPIAGEGAPLVAEFCLAELGAVLGLRTEAAEQLAGDALELRHRLPRCWKQVMDLRLPAWRARRIADAACHLSLEAALFVDAQISAFAHKIGPTATSRLVEEATQRFMPETAEKERLAAADQRGVQVDTRTRSFAGTGTGTGTVFGELDLADAHDLDTALTLRAAALADPRPQSNGGREVVLHVHTTPEAVAANTEDELGKRDLTGVCRVACWRSSLRPKRFGWPSVRGW